MHFTIRNCRALIPWEHNFNKSLNITNLYIWLLHNDNKILKYICLNINKLLRDSLFNPCKFRARLKAGCSSFVHKYYSVDLKYRNSHCCWHHSPPSGSRTVCVLKHNAQRNGISPCELPFPGYWNGSSCQRWWKMWRKTISEKLKW